jgi:hypothetical protein
MGSSLERRARTHETPTGAAESWLLAFAGGVEGTLNVSASIPDAAWLRNHATENREVIVAIDWS